MERIRGHSWFIVSDMQSVWCVSLFNDHRNVVYFKHNRSDWLSTDSVTHSANIYVNILIVLIHQYAIFSCFVRRTLIHILHSVDIPGLRNDFPQGMLVPKVCFLIWSEGLAIFLFMNNILCKGCQQDWHKGRSRIRYINHKYKSLKYKRVRPLDTLPWE